MTTLRLPIPQDRKMLFLTDNGAARCGTHLGMSARYTGRDISGQPIHRVTVADAAYFRAEFGECLQCEMCRAKRGAA